MTAVCDMWAAAGHPAPNWQGKAKRTVTSPTPRVGTCALTGETGQVWPLAKVTTTLTTLDRFPFRDLDPAGVAVGQAAAWAIRERVAMQQPHAHIDGCWLGPVDPPGLHAALLALPDDPFGWVGVPQSRQKHLLPWAEPGTVRVDDEALRWDAADVDRLGTYQALRSLGYGETALTEATPRWPVLQRADSPERQWTLMHWSDLDPWRHHPAYLDVAARATRTPKETP